MHEAEFDRFADEYEAQHRASIAITGEDPEFFAAYKVAQLARVAGQLWPMPRRILDFGSGIGSSIPYFRKHFPEAELTCVDASSRSLELSQRRFPGPERYLLVNARGIPQESEAFDIVFSACVFHHIPHEEHGLWLRELRRVAQTRGILAIFEHNPLNPLTVHAVNTCPFDKNAKLIRAKSLLQSLRETGWRKASARYHIFFPRSLARLRSLESYLYRVPVGAQYSVTAQKL